MFGSIIPAFIRHSLIVPKSSLVMKTIHCRNYKIYRDIRKKLTYLENPIYFRRKYNNIGSGYLRIISGFLCGAGLLVAADVGLNFDLALKFSKNESMINNLKAIVMALMMSDCLTSEEIDLMTSIVEILPLSDKNSCQREKWCESEMMKFMTCAEKFGSIRSEHCSTYRTFLKSCLQAKTNCQQVRFSTIVSATQCAQNKEASMEPQPADPTTCITQADEEDETNNTDSKDCKPELMNELEAEADDCDDTSEVDEEEDECSCCSCPTEETNSDDKSLKFLL